MDPATQAAAQPAHEAPGLIELMLTADPIVQVDLLVLIVMSIACWAIIAQKLVRLRAASASTQAFLDLFWKSRRLDSVFERSAEYQQSPVANVFSAGYRELQRIAQGGAGQDAEANVERSLRRAAQSELARLEQHVSVLATTGSTAPFIGLFGTVWGILQAFMKLGQPGAAATIQVIGPDIAHALVATAVGLVAAIPAVMAYNWCNASIRAISGEMDTFSADFLNLVKRKAS